LLGSSNKDKNRKDGGFNKDGKMVDYCRSQNGIMRNVTDTAGIKQIRKDKHVCVEHCFSQIRHTLQHFRSEFKNQYRM